MRRLLTLIRGMESPRCVRADKAVSVRNAVGLETGPMFLPSSSTPPPHGYAVLRLLENHADYVMCSDAALPASPMPHAVVRLVDLHIHTGEIAHCCWSGCAFEPPAWVKAEEGHPYPTLEAYVLCMLCKGEPKWTQGKLYQ